MSAAGEVVLLPVPFTNLTSLKRRPVLVIRDSDDQGDFIALPVTSQAQPAPAIPLTATDFSRGLLAKPSWVRTDKFYTFHDSIVVAVLGAITTECQSRISKAVCHGLGCLK